MKPLPVFIWDDGDFCSIDSISGLNFEYDYHEKMKYQGYQNKRRPDQNLPYERSYFLIKLNLKKFQIL